MSQRVHIHRAECTAVNHHKVVYHHGVYICGTAGSEESGSANASARGGDIVLQSRFTDRASDNEAVARPTSETGTIVINAPVFSDARAFIDSVAEGQEAE